MVCCAAFAYVDACQAEIVLNCSSFRSAVSTLQLLLSNFLRQCVTVWIFIICMMCCQCVCARTCFIRLWIVIEASSHPSHTEGGKPVREIKSHELTKPINTLFLSQLTIIFLHLFISFSFLRCSKVYHCLENHSNRIFLEVKWQYRQWMWI